MKNPISLGVTLIRVPSVLKVLMNVGGDRIVEGGELRRGGAFVIPVCKWMWVSLGACAGEMGALKSTHTEQLVCVK